MNHARVQLGLKQNFSQFSLLILINAFVGAMVGLERSILPELAEKEFHLCRKIRTEPPRCLKLSLEEAEADGLNTYTL